MNQEYVSHNNSSVKKGHGKQGCSNRRYGNQCNNGNDNLRNDAIPEWKKKAPDAKDKDKSKKKDSKVCLWGPYHTLWCIHKPSQYHKAPHNNINNNYDNSQSYPSTSSTNAAPRLQETSYFNPQLRLQVAVPSIRKDSEKQHGSGKIIVPEQNMEEKKKAKFTVEHVALLAQAARKAAQEQLPYDTYSYTIGIVVTTSLVLVTTSQMV
jgi:hypothetical protein